MDRDPSHIMQVGMGFWPAKTLLSAVELGLFTQLGADAMTGEELARAARPAPARDPDFLDALVALGLLERDGDGPDGALPQHAGDAPSSSTRTSPDYIGGILEMANARLYRFWGDLTEALRTGKPQNEIKHTGTPMFEELYSEPARLEQFMDAMAGISRGNFQALAEKFDFSPLPDAVRRRRRHRPAARSIVAARHPHLRCTSFDLPVVEPIAERAIAAAGPRRPRGRRVRRLLRRPAAEGRRHHDGHDPPRLEPREEDAPDPRGLRRAARRAARSSSIENLIDDARRENAFGLMMSLNMLIEFGDAFDFTGADFDGWCSEVGFRASRSSRWRARRAPAIAYK